MSLVRRWPNGVPSMPVSARGTPMLTSPDMAALDQNAQASLDKTAAGCTVYGPMTLGPGGCISLDSPTSKFVVNGTGATTSAGGRIVCGNNDYPVFATPTSTQSYVPFAEMFSNRNGFSSVFWPVPASVPLNWQWYADPTGSMYSGTNQGQIPNGAAVVPVTRIHDGSTIFRVNVYFFVNTFRTALPGRYPQFAFLQYDPSLNETVNLTGWTPFPAPANLAAYVNGGSVNQISAAVPSVTVNCGKYIYAIALLDEDYANETEPSVPNQYPAFLLINSVTSMRFQ